MMRKSRSPRMRMALLDGPDLEFRLTESQWHRIDCIYTTLSTDDRMEISKIVDAHLRAYRSEKEAPFVHEGVNWVIEVEKRCNDLIAVADRSSKGRHGDGPSFAQTYIAQEIPRLPIRHDDGAPQCLCWHEVIGFLHSLNRACNKTMQRLREDEGLGIEEGRSWSVMIIRLTNFAKSRNYPCGVSKSDNKKNSVSPFTELISEIQLHLPIDARRHTYSLAALAEGIARARQAFSPTSRNIN